MRSPSPSSGRRQLPRPARQLSLRNPLRCSMTALHSSQPADPAAATTQRGPVGYPAPGVRGRRPTPPRPRGRRHHPSNAICRVRQAASKAEPPDSDRDLGAHDVRHHRRRRSPDFRIAVADPRIRTANHRIFIAAASPARPGRAVVHRPPPPLGCGGGLRRQRICRRLQQRAGFEAGSGLHHPGGAAVHRPEQPRGSCGGRRRQRTPGSTPTTNGF